MIKKALLFCLFTFTYSSFSLDLFHEISAGYYGDLGVSMALRLENPTPDFPFFAQVRGGYIYQFDPGNATEARKIFINDNAGGNIEKYGESIWSELIWDGNGGTWKTFPWSFSCPGCGTITVPITLSSVTTKLLALLLRPLNRSGGGRTHPAEQYRQLLYSQRRNGVFL